MTDFHRLKWRVDAQVERLGWVTSTRLCLDESVQDAPKDVLDRILAELRDDGRVLEIKGHRHHEDPRWSGFPTKKLRPWSSVVCQCSVAPINGTPECYPVSIWVSTLWLSRAVGFEAGSDDWDERGPAPSRRRGPARGS